MGKETGFSRVHMGELRCRSGDTTVTSQMEPREGGTVEDTEALGDPWVEFYLFEARQDFR